MKCFLHLFPGKATWKFFGIGILCLSFFPQFAFSSNPNEVSLTVMVNGTNPLCGGFSTGSATATPWGGIAPYSYNWSNGATTQTINNLPIGTYSVTVTDATNATASGNVTLTAPPVLSGTVSTTCGNPGTATANPVGGIPGYTYLWTNGATSQTIVNLPPGQYCVTIMDSNSCGVVACGNTGTGPTISVTTTNTGCNGGNTGTATANSSNGTAPFTYVWSNGGTNQTINNLSAGVYNVTVTDNNGCTGTGSGTVQSSNNGFPVWLTTTPPSSCSSNNGIITANPQGGVSPYTYTWNNGATTQTINNLGPGTYTVTVTDAVGCSATKTTTLSAPSNVSAWISATDESCPGANDGTATASGMGGTQPYTFLWSNGQSSATITGLSPGNYTVTVSDFYGCSGSASITVNAGTSFALMINAQNVSSCGANNGSAMAVPSGGNNPYTYLWNTGATTQSIFNLSAGFYSLTATDNNGCSKVATVTITEPPNLTVSINATPQVCNNANNGMASAFVNGGTAPFSYSWSNGGNTQTINNLGAGTYTVTVNDINGCQGTASATITNSDLIIDAIITNTSCYGSSDGQIEVSGWGGTPPYTYQWNNGSTNPILNNLLAGNYTVTVYDSGNCSVSQTITVTEPPMILINFSTVQPDCAGGNGSATANVSGGTPGYTYQWSNGATGATALNLAPGTYTVTITDTHDCVEVGAVNITSPPPLSANVNGNEPSCNGGNDGSATAQIFGGTPPFSYSWSNGGNTQTISNLTAGAYSVTVSDAQGCSGTGNIWLNEPPNLNLMITSTPIVCPNQNNGMAAVFPNGGTPPYSYLWSTGSNSQMIGGLEAGTYSVTVTDANNCIKIASTIINASDLITDVAKADVACFGESTGSILVSGWGGQPPYTYLWNTGATTEEISNLPIGTYTVTITDAAGCQTIEAISINQPSPINVSASSTPAGCSVNNGTATVNASGGIPPYTYAWNNFQTTQTISNLAPGTYTVTVQDANFCTKSTSVTVAGGTNFNVSINAVNVTCNGGTDGFAMAIAAGGQQPYTYQWSTGMTSGGISGLGAGSYSVTVTDVLGCTGSSNVTIAEPAPINANVSTQNTICGLNNGSASANVTVGGQAPFNYNWSNGANTQTITNLAPGTYTVTITDSNNCQTTATGTVTGGSAISVNVNLTNVSCFGGNNGSATANVAGGQAPFTYSWSNGSTGQTAFNLSTGQYTVTVTDANGCTDTETVLIAEPAQIFIAVNSTNESCAGSNDGTASVNINAGGTAPFSYNWSNGQSSANIFDLAPGTYSVTVTDANNCQKIGQTTVSPGANLSVNTNGTNLSCFGSNDGSATANVASGNTPFSYSWSNGGNAQTINGLSAGTYTVTVTDNLGCTGTSSISISQPSSINLSVSKNDPTCGLNNGSATASAIGGTPGFTYAWSNGSSGSTINGLGAGTYTVTATDSNGCTKTGSVTLQGSSPINVTTLVISTTCAGANNGSASASATGGTAPYTYLWSTGDIGDTVYGLSSGSYTVTVTSSNGCTGIGNVFIPTAASPTCTAWVIQQPTTPNTNDGISEVTGTGGAAPYTYLWSNGQTTKQATGLDEGTYSVTITDWNGCTCVSSVTLVAPPGMCDNVTDPGEICCNQTLCGPGNIPAPLTETIPASGGSGALEYVWMFTTNSGPFNQNTWNVIPGANGPTYAPGPIYETSYFIRCVRREFCTDFYESNIIIITIGNVAVAEISGPTLVCVGDTETYTSTSSPGATYLWDFGSGANPATSTNQNEDVTWNTWGVKTVTLTVTKNGCVSTDELDVNVTNNPVFCGNAIVIEAEPMSQELVYIGWEFETALYDSLKFVVERSADKIEFYPIGEVDFDPNSTNNRYKFFDQAPKKGRSFYRVQLIDPATGQSTKSNTEEIKLTEGVSLVHIYPNPTTDFIFVEVMEDYGNEVSFEVYSANGILLENIVLAANSFRQEIDLSTYPSGMYVLILNFDGQRQKTIRLIKE
jgi:hypothetical protein